MPPRRSEQPRTHIEAGQWPHGRLRDTAPVEAHYCQALARQLGSAMATSGLSLHALAELTGVGRQTIVRTVSGETVPDLGTVARLEARLDVDLWPGRAAVPSPVGGRPAPGTRH